MYCTNCGEKLDAGWKYCPNCNSPIKAPNIENNPLSGVNYQPNNNENSTPDTEDDKIAKRYYIVGALGCEVVSFTGLSFLLFISIGIAIAGMIKYPNDKGMKLVFALTLLPIIIVLLLIVVILFSCRNIPG